MEKINYAVIGVGGVGKAHVRAAKELGNVSLVAVADINEEIGRKIGEEYSVKWYKDYHEMLDKENIDAVSIAVPHFLHAPITIDVIDNFKKHVLIEKPIAVTVKEADSMVTTARKNNVKLAVCFQRRYSGISMALDEIIKSGKLGHMLRGVMLHLTFRDMIYYSSGAWRGKWAKEGGGVLINQGIHTLDYFLWLANEKPKKLFAFANNLLHDIEVEDVASASLVFENGAQAVLQFSCFDKPGRNLIHIKYERGTLDISDNVRIAYTPDLSEMVSGNIPHKSINIDWVDVKPKQVKYEGHTGVVYDFVEAIIEDREPLVNGEESIRSLEVVNAIIMSAVLHKPVDFPINREAYERVWNDLKEAKTIKTFQ